MTNKTALIYVGVVSFEVCVTLRYTRGCDNASRSLDQSRHIDRTNNEGVVYAEGSTFQGLLDEEYIKSSPQHSAISTHGHYYLGAKIGTWTNRYSDGALRSVESFSRPYCTTNSLYDIEIWKTDLVEASYYTPSGRLFSSVHQKKGVICSFTHSDFPKEPNGDIYLATTGYDDSYSILYNRQAIHEFRHTGTIGEYFPIREFNSSRDHVIGFVEPDGRLRSLRQLNADGRWSVFGADEITDEENDEGMTAPFLLGTPVILPSYEDGTLRFELALSCTGGVVSLSLLQPPRDVIDVIP